MLRQIKKTDLALGIILGALVGIAMCAIAIGALYSAFPDSFEHLFAPG